MNNLLVFAIIAIGLIYVMNQNKNSKEGFSNKSGQFCPTCRGKTPNQCFGCANCGVLVDMYGNSGCIGGNIRGPYNKEGTQANSQWYHGDPYARMIQNNANYKCSYGPSNASRVI